MTTIEALETAKTHYANMAAELAASQIRLDIAKAAHAANPSKETAEDVALWTRHLPDPTRWEREAREQLAAAYKTALAG